MLYLIYETTSGTIARLKRQMDAVLPVLIALAGEHDRIDQDAVREALNGITPEDFLLEGTDVPS